MSTIPTESELEKERAALTGGDAWLAELNRQRGDLRICFDEEDGWFVKVMFNRNFEGGGWHTLDPNEARHSSPTDAIRAAVEAHNCEIATARRARRHTSYTPISANH